MLVPRRLGGRAGGSSFDQPAGCGDERGVRGKEYVEISWAVVLGIDRTQHAALATTSRVEARRSNTTTSSLAAGPSLAAGLGPPCSFREVWGAELEVRASIN